MAEQEQQSDISAILSNIRSIIVDGEEPVTEDVLVLTKKVKSGTVSGEPAAADAAVQSEADILAAIDEEPALISDEAASVAKSVIADAMATVGVATSGHSSRVSGSLDEMVANLLKQELQVWLDKNLERIVRDIVTKEITRIIPR